MPRKPKGEAKVQVGARVPEGLYRRLKVLAGWLGVPVQELVIEGVKAVLNKHPLKVSKGTK